MLVHGDVVFVVGFEGHHEVMGVGVGDGLVHEDRRDVVMLLLGVDGEVNDVDALLLMELVGPFLVQIVLAEDEVPEGPEARVFLDEVLVGLQIRAKLGQIIAEEIIRLRFVGYDQDTV